MDNEEIQGVKFSEFPSQTPGNSDEVVGLHSGDNARFTIANIVAAVRNGLASIFVPLTRTINGKGLSSDITLDASDVGAVDTADVGIADGVASLDNTGKVPSSQLPPIASTASDVTYDNTTSGLTADDVQEAIDELAAGAGGGGVDPETIAPVEETSTATTAHPLGTVFYYNDLLYRALADIPVGGTINTSAGGNATQTSIAQNFKRVVTLTAAEYALLSSAEKAADIVYIVTDDNAISAEDVSYDPTTSGATATNVQDALDEAFDDLDGKQAEITAYGILKGDGAGGVTAATAGTDYQAPLTAGTDYATPAQLANKEDKFYQPGDTIDCTAYPYLVGMTAGSGSNLRLTVSVYTPKTNGLNLNISHNLTAAWIRGEGNQYSGSIPQNAVSVVGNWLFISVYSTSLPALRVLVAAIGGTITFS